MKLYYSPGACSLAPHIVAREAGVAVDLVKVDLKAHKTEHGDDYYAINPRGYVPAVTLDDGTLLTEAGTLVQMLADRGKANGLIPAAGTAERLKVQEWLTFIGTELHKTIGWLFQADIEPGTREKVLTRTAARLGDIDKRLEGRNFLTGNDFTVADAYAFTIINWTNFVGIDLAPYPNIQAFMARVADRPKVREALAAEGLLPA
jgi:glutathione S-transferase